MAAQIVIDILTGSLNNIKGSIQRCESYIKNSEKELSDLKKDLANKISEKEAIEKQLEEFNKPVSRYSKFKKKVKSILVSEKDNNEK